MTRTTTLDTIAANGHAKWFILIDVADIPTTLQLTTFDDQPTDFAAYRSWLINTMMAVGPELDWRGGLAADEPFSVTIAQQFASATGTTSNNTFDRLFPLLGHENYSSTFRESVVLNGGSGAVTVKLASYNSTPAGVSATIYTGQTRNLSIDDYELRLEFGSSLRANLDRAFLARLGREPAGQENYDTTLGREIVSQSEGQAVPIVYGFVPLAEGLYVHEENTSDDTIRSGLILCFSDIRFDTNHINGLDIDLPWMAVYDAATDELYSVMKTDLEAGTSGNTQYEVSATNLTMPELNLVPTGIGSGTASHTGYFIRFTDEIEDTPVGTDAPRFAGGGKLLLRRGAQTDGAAFSPKTQKVIVRQGFHYSSSGGGPLWTDVELGADNDDTTFATTDLVTGVSGQVNGSRRYYVWSSPQLNFKGQMYRFFLRPKYEHSGTAGTQNTRAWYHDGSSFQNSYDYVASAATDRTSSTFNSWTGADSQYRFGWAPTATPAEFSRGGKTAIWLGINATSGMTQTMDVYGADYEVWWDVDWTEYRNKVYAWAAGVKDNNHEYTSGTNATLINPAEIFSHFVEEVCGLTAEVSVSTASNMDDAGLRADFQLTDGEMTRREFLEALALQFMSHIVPTDDGALKLVFRGSDLASLPANFLTPITTSDILKGSFRTYLTDQDELYAGIVVNYAWNAPRQKYEGQWVIAPAASELETNVSSPTDYQGLADMVDVDRERILEVNAWMIRDADTAERLCKFLMQQHCRRRQLVEFETTLELFDILPGDTIWINDPRIFPYVSANTATFSTFPSNLATITGSASTFPSTAPAGACHVGDILIVESGAKAGHYMISPSSSTDVSVTDVSVAFSAGATGPLRVVPTFDVLAAQVVYDHTKGPRMRIKAIEHPIIRAGATTI